MRCRTSALTVATAPSLLLNGRDLLSSAGHELNALPLQGHDPQTNALVGKYVCTVVNGFVDGWWGWLQ